MSPTVKAALTGAAAYFVAQYVQRWAAAQTQFPELAARNGLVALTTTVAVVVVASKL